jgi:hypothetical protein
MGLYRVTRLLLLSGAAVVLASCGHNSSTTTNTNTPASITPNPTSFSLNHGDVSQFGGVQVFNSSNTAIAAPPTITYTSSNPNAVTVTSTGVVCAGVFDANNIVCQTKDSNGNPLQDTTVNITVSSGGVSAVVPVYVHKKIDTITVAGPTNPPVCLSQSQTEQFSAQALSAGSVTTNTGPFTWATGSASIATVDTNGVVTSRLPGATTVVASIGAVTGTPAVLVACPPKTISLHLTGVTDTMFSVATGTSESLQADVTDILGQPITGASLSYSSYVPSTVTASTTSVTTPGAGTSSIVASCTPPGCNTAAGPNVNFNGTGAGLAVYSNLVVGTVSGSTATTVYVTGPDNPDGSANTSLIPITISSNAAGTAVALSGSPNSMVFNRSGSQAYIGSSSSSGLMIFNPTSNTVTASASGITGKVLTVSNDGNLVVVSDTANSKVFVYNVGSNTSQEFDIAGVTAADFGSNNSKAYFTSGAAVYEFSGSTSSLKTLTFAGDGVVFTPQASVAYFGGSSIVGLAVCNDAHVDSAAGAANILSATPDGTFMIGAGSAGWANLSYTVATNTATGSTGCPPVVSNALTTAGFNASFVTTPSQIAVTSNDKYAFLTGCAGGCSGATGVPFFQFGTNATGTIPLTGGSATLYSGSLTQDATSLYVGVNSGGNGSVHRIDLTQSPPTDANQISVSFNPKIVVVRPQ